jgi:hypothetical protein
MSELTNEIPYETKFEDGTEITDYLAVGIAEGFEKADCDADVIRAWSYICGKQLYRSLQGFFGRNVEALIEKGVFRGNGKVDWDRYTELLNEFYST